MRKSWSAKKNEKTERFLYFIRNLKGCEYFMKDPTTKIQPKENCFNNSPQLIVNSGINNDITISR
jgi:hypothetical protein